MYCEGHLRPVLQELQAATTLQLHFIGLKEVRGCMRQASDMVTGYSSAEASHGTCHDGVNVDVNVVSMWGTG